jgi:hypothetical protein
MSAHIPKHGYLEGRSPSRGKLANRVALHMSARAAVRLRILGFCCASVRLSSQNAHEAKEETVFHLLAASREGLGLPSVEPTYDLVIVKASQYSVSTTIGVFAQSLNPLLRPTALTLFVRPNRRLFSRLAALAADHGPVAEVALEETDTKPVAARYAGSVGSSGTESDDTDLTTPSSTLRVVQRLHRHFIQVV